MDSRQDCEEEIGAKPLGEFVRKITGLDMGAAKEAFSKCLSAPSPDSWQIYTSSTRWWSTSFTMA